MQAPDLDPCEILEWDTAFWGFPIARIRASRLGRHQVSRVDAWCRGRGIRCLFFLASSDDSATTRLAEENDFHLVDVRLTLAWEAPLVVPTDRGRFPADVVRASRTDDIPHLQRIARALYHDTRFYHDGNFPRHLCDLFYETWIKRSCEGYADHVLVAEVEGEPLGYVTCHRERSSQTGRIGLVGVSGSAQGQGVGHRLVSGALEWFVAQDVQRVSVVTQARNCAAQRLYQRCGFFSESVYLWYHKWYPGRELASE